MEGILHLSDPILWLIFRAIGTCIHFHIKRLYFVQDVIAHWFDLMNEEGWIPREQILGAEAQSKVPSVSCNVASCPVGDRMIVSRDIA